MGRMFSRGWCIWKGVYGTGLYTGASVHVHGQWDLWWWSAHITHPPTSISIALPYTPYTPFPPPSPPVLDRFLSLQVRISMHSLLNICCSIEIPSMKMPLGPCWATCIILLCQSIGDYVRSRSEFWESNACWYFGRYSTTWIKHCLPPTCPSNLH